VVANDTVNINEYSYFFLMLIGQYMQPAIDVWTDQVLFADKIKNRGKYLMTEQYRKLIALMCQNIYLHAPSKEDLITEVDEEKQKMKFERAVATAMHKKVEERESEKLVMKDFNEITYLEDY